MLKEVLFKPNNRYIVIKANDAVEIFFEYNLAFVVALHLHRF